MKAGAKRCTGKPTYDKKIENGFSCSAFRARLGREWVENGMCAIGATEGNKLPCIACG